MFELKHIAVTAAALLGTTSLCASDLHPALSALLYSQTDNDNGQGILSLNFLDSGFDAYDSEAADDFAIHAGKTWTIDEVYASGTYFDGAGSAESFNVTFYKSKKGQVGEAIHTCLNAPYRFDGRFDFGSEYIKCRVKLPKGRYFVGVQANATFATAGEWGWLTNNAVRHAPSQWRNPGDGLDTGCTDFRSTLACIPNGEGGDYSFALYGRERNSP
jgi:hypothetical protein